jgi:uncharacterized protein YaeQ
MELNFNYVNFGNKVIYHVATILAVIVGVVSYSYTALQLWWEENNEDVVTNVKLFVNKVSNYVSDVTEVEVAQES